MGRHVPAGRGARKPGGLSRSGRRADLAAALKHALWIGGPPGSGKTTIATRLARRYGLRWYGADTQTWAHRDRALAAGDPAALEWEAMPPAECATGTPAEQLGRSLYAERGPMIVEDVSRLPASPLVVAEGSLLAPGLVALGAADRRARGLASADTCSAARATRRARAAEAGP